MGAEVDNMKLPKGVLDEQELEEIMEEETGLDEAAEEQMEKKTVDKGADSLLKKIDALEKEIASLKSETAFLRVMVKEQSGTLLELARLVKELMEEKG